MYGVVRFLQVTRRIEAPMNDSAVTGSNPTPNKNDTRDGRGAGNFFVPGLTRGIEVKIASGFDELEQAFALLAENYRARGYDAPGAVPYRFTPFHALHETVTIVAKDGQRVVATLSLVPDGPILGLPMESIYGEEIAALRREGRRMAEAISLADGGLSIHEFVLVFKAMIKLAMQYHARNGGDTWVITINPRHRNFYQKVLGFAPLGGCRSYPTVQDHPAEAYLLDLDLMRDGAPKLYDEIFAETLPDSVLEAGDWSAAQVRYFGSHSSQIDPEAIEGLLETVEQRGVAVLAA
jgi:hypothetical protein